MQSRTNVSISSKIFCLCGCCNFAINYLLDNSHRLIESANVTHLHCVGVRCQSPRNCVFLARQTKKVENAALIQLCRAVLQQPDPFDEKVMELRVINGVARNLCLRTESPLITVGTSFGCHLTWEHLPTSVKSASPWPIASTTRTNLTNNIPISEHHWTDRFSGNTPGFIFQWEMGFEWFYHISCRKQLLIWMLQP